MFRIMRNARGNRIISSGELNQGLSPQRNPRNRRELTWGVDLENRVGRALQNSMERRPEFELVH